MPEFTGDTTLEEVLKDPRGALILRRYGIPCPICPLARAEMKELKLKDVARMYGVDLDSLLRALNEGLKEGKGACSCC